MDWLSVRENIRVAFQNALEDILQQIKNEEKTPDQISSQMQSIYFIRNDCIDDLLEFSCIVSEKLKEHPTILQDAIIELETQIHTLEFMLEHNDTVESSKEEIETRLRMSKRHLEMFKSIV